MIVQQNEEIYNSNYNSVRNAYITITRGFAFV
jgi:hypothetical protein